MTRILFLLKHSPAWLTLKGARGSATRRVWRYKVLTVFEVKVGSRKRPPRHCLTVLGQ